jgi:hypothetical protein
VCGLSLGHISCSLFALFLASTLSTMSPRRGGIKVRGNKQALEGSFVQKSNKATARDLLKGRGTRVLEEMNGTRNRPGSLASNRPSAAKTPSSTTQAGTSLREKPLFGSLQETPEDGHRNTLERDQDLDDDDGPPMSNTLHTHDWLGRLTKSSTQKKRKCNYHIVLEQRCLLQIDCSLLTFYL